MNPAVTSLEAERDKTAITLSKVVSALATLRTGVAAFTPDRTLLFSSPRFAELLGLPAERLQPGMGFGDLLKLMAARGEFSGQDGGAFIAAERDADRSPYLRQWPGHRCQFGSAVQWQLDNGGD